MGFKTIADVRAANKTIGTWSRPYHGVTHLYGVKKMYQVTVTVCAPDDVVTGGADWYVLALDGWITLAEGTEETMEAAREAAKDAAVGFRLLESGA